MDKIQKALKRLSAKERTRAKEILMRLGRGDNTGFDIQKLKGHSDIYRVCKGSIRIIYRQSKDDLFVLAIERRSESTYRNY